MRERRIPRVSFTAEQKALRTLEGAKNIIGLLTGSLVISQARSIAK